MKGLILPKPEQYPKYIVIGPGLIKYDIIFTSKPKWLGKTSYPRKWIKLNSKQSRSALFSTFIHEVLHAIEFEYALEIKHSLIYQLEPALFAFLRLNFKSLEFFQKVKRERRKKESTHVPASPADTGQGAKEAVEGGGAEGAKLKRARRCKQGAKNARDKHKRGLRR